MPAPKGAALKLDCVRNMNIAFVTQALPYLPSRDGFRLYAANLIRVLARRHRIDLITLFEEEDRPHLNWANQYCASVTLFSKSALSRLLTPINFFSTYAMGKPLRFRKRMAAALHAGLQSRSWQLVHVEGGYAGGLVPFDLSVPKILSLHDSWTIRCAHLAKCSPAWRERLYYTSLAQVEPHYERMVYPRFNRCVVVAERDALAVRSTVPSCDVNIIPNGIDTDYFRPSAVGKRATSMVFHGNLSYAPNIEAAVHFARDIFPRIQAVVPSATFHMVGAAPALPVRELSSLPGISLSADLQDLRPALCAAQIYVCPIRHGSGVKNKLLEALAMSLPVVCYPESAEGIETNAGEHVLIARSPDEFVEYLVGLIRDPTLGEDIALAGRTFVRERHSWESRAVAFEDLYRTVIAEFQRTSTRNGKRRAENKIESYRALPAQSCIVETPNETGVDSLGLERASVEQKEK